MSRFFRNEAAHSFSSADSLGGSSDSRSYSLNQLIDNRRATRPLSPSAFVSHTSNPAVANVNDQRDLLLHALLEERCLRQAQADLRDGGSSERVREVANRRYRHMSQQLMRLGLTSTGPESHDLSSTRQQVRDGLDLLLEGFSDFALSDNKHQTTHELQRLSFENETLQLARQMINLPGLPVRYPDTTYRFTGLEIDKRRPTHAALIDTRYRRDFEEIEMLGKGGFGIVHRCRHRWDGLSYAVKRIPLSAGCVQNIQQRGQAEVDKILLELRTLARLDHPNIVRYFSGWIELCHFGNSISSTPLASMAATSATNLQSWSTRSVAEVNNAGDGELSDFITFEHSRSQRSKSTSAGASQETYGGSTSGPVHRTQTHAKVSDGDVENISRRTSSNVDPSTLATHVRNATTCLALHIQMGLYPLTLADILIDEPENTSRHCFHIEPSAKLLSALVEGVAYLHDQGVIHRDLKPANIFLTVQGDTKSSACGFCEARELKSSTYKLRIGDFGLVTAVAQHVLGAEATPVGTEMYHPPSPCRPAGLQALDWYAVGMIAFELIWPFSTRMERYQTLGALKSGAYPLEFTTRFGQASSQISELIEHLLRPSTVIDVQKLRRMLGLIYSQ